MDTTINLRRPSSAQALPTKITIVNPTSNDELIKTVLNSNNHILLKSIQEFLPNTTPQDIIDDLLLINANLQNVAKCVSHLQRLDAELKLELEKFGCNLEGVRPEYFALSCNGEIIFPGPPEKEVVHNKYGALTSILLRHQKDAGINPDEKTFKFIGSVHPSFADSFFKKYKAIFKDSEQAQKELNGLKHGANSHYLQFYIIEQIINDNIDSLKCLRNLQHVLFLLTSIRYDMQYLWNYMIDHLAKTPLDRDGTFCVDFGSPYHCESAIMLLGEKYNLKTLAAYIYDNKVKQVSQMWHRFCKDNEMNISFKEFYEKYLLENEFYQEESLSEKKLPVLEPSEALSMPGYKDLFPDADRYSVICGSKVEKGGYIAEKTRREEPKKWEKLSVADYTKFKCEKKLIGKDSDDEARAEKDDVVGDGTQAAEAKPSITPKTKKHNTTKSRTCNIL